jgi:hypothetical protein
VERAIAQRLGGERIGHLGGADIDAGWLSVEVKTRRTLPQWIRDAIAQTKRNGGVEQLSVVILHQQGQRHNGDLVVMTLADFECWFGGGVGPHSVLVADARYLAAQGEKESAAFLEVATPDKVQE